MVLDTLEILIEGNAAGLTTQLKTANQAITSFVSQMNSQEVNWTSILSRSISPAIITGIASMFAMAITNSLSFQDATVKTGEAAGVTGDALSAMQEQSKQLSTQTGLSAQEISQAYGKVIPIFSDAATAQAVVTDAAKLSAAGFGNLGDIIDSMVPILQEWGVTTADQADSVITAVANAAAHSGESLSSMVTQFDQFSPQLLRAGMGLGQFTDLITTFGVEVAKVGVSQAGAVFDAIGKAADGSNPALASFAGGYKALQEKIKDHGMIDAIDDLGKTIQSRLGKDGMQVVMDAFQLSEGAVNGFNNTTKKFPEISKEIQDIERNQKSVKTMFDETDTSLRTLETTFQEIKNDLTSPEILTALNGILGVVDFILKGWEGIFGLLEDIDGLTKSQMQADALSDVAKKSVDNKLLNLPSGVAFSQKQASAIEGLAQNTKDPATGSNEMSKLLEAITRGISTSGSQNTSFMNTFNIHGNGQTQLTADQVVKQLYAQFQGIQ